MDMFLLLLKKVNIMKIKRKSIKLIVLFLFGFFAYMLVELIYRQYTYFLMGVCGGLAFIIIDSINNKISWDIDILLQGVIGSAVITTFEFIIGELSLHNILPIMWDYSQYTIKL